MDKVQISKKLRLTSSIIRRFGVRFNANDVRNDSTRTERPIVATDGRDWHSVTSHVKNRLMPVVVTARNAPRTHSNSATGLFSETRMCCGG